ncbi:MAG: Trk system potassium transporter TrkA [Clostridia bacterium]|nr:Trk system potassium transporter TrkA [Clostridia bacterium]
MNIIIVGMGKLGMTLTSQLSGENHDVVVVDINGSVVTNTVDSYDVMGICGNGSTVEILREAGAKKAKLLIACTGSDELNILCCTFAKNLGTEYTIARVRNPDYATQTQFLREKIGINMIVNPEYETANEISRIIRFPSVASLDSFARGKVEMARIVLHSDNPLCDMQISEIRKKFKANVIICAVQRGNSVYIPGGKFELKREDSINITGTRTEISTFLKQTGVYKHRIKNVMIIGGGKIGFYLSELLSDTSRNIKLIDSDPARCHDLTNALTDVSIICGDGTDQAILDEQGLDNQDALVALTGIDEENIVVSLYAESKNVKKVIAKVNRHSYSILNNIGLETLVSPQNVAGSLVTRYVRALENSSGSANIQTLYKLVGGKIEAAEFIVPQNWAHNDETIKEMNLKSNLIVACIIRNGKVIYPNGDDCINSGDNVVIVTAGNSIKELHDIFKLG